MRVKGISNQGMNRLAKAVKGQASGDNYEVFVWDEVGDEIHGSGVMVDINDSAENIDSAVSRAFGEEEGANNITSDEMVNNNRVIKGTYGRDKLFMFVIGPESQEEAQGVFEVFN